MRVLHVVNEFLPYTRAGTEYYVAELAMAQASLGATPLVLQLMPATVRDSGGFAPYAIVPAPFPDLPAYMIALPDQEQGQVENPRLAEALAAWLEQIRPDAIHVHSCIGYTVSLLDAVPRGVPLVMTLHDFWLPCANAILVHARGEKICSGPESVEKCARCVMPRLGTRKAALDFIRRRLDAHKKALARLDAAICPSHFSLRGYRSLGFDAPTLLRDPLGMAPLENVRRKQEDLLRFTCLGGVTWFKGQDLAVTAFLALKPENARLDIHGMVSNKAYFEQLHALTRNTEAVVWHGAYGKEDLGRILGRSDVVLLPSRMESYSFVAREALAAGVPVIASDCGALPEIVHHGRNGLLFKSGDAADLAKKMALLARDPELLQRLRLGIRPVKTAHEDALRQLRRYGELRGATGNS